MSSESWDRRCCISDTRFPNNGLSAVEVLLRAPREHIESVYDEIDRNLAGNASAATTNIRIRNYQRLHFPAGDRHSEKGGDPALPHEDLDRRLWSSRSPDHVQRRADCHLRTIAESN